MPISSTRKRAFEERKAYLLLAKRTLLLVGKLESARRTVPSLGVFADMLTSEARPTPGVEVSEPVDNALRVQSSLLQLEDDVGTILEYYQRLPETFDRFKLLSSFRRREHRSIEFVRTGLLDQYELLNLMPATCLVCGAMSPVGRTLTQ